MAKKNALGKGLEALFADNNENDNSPGTVSLLRISYIQPNRNQPRKSFNNESLSELADSITRHGLIQPIVVRNLPNGYYQIISGERRWRAAKMAGLDEVPVVVRDVDDMSAAELALVENLQREDLNPVEEALGYKYLSETYSLTQEEIAKRVAKSRSVVANALRLFALPEEVLHLLGAGDITTGHARALITLPNPEEQIRIATRIADKGMSVREVEALVRSLQKPSDPEGGDPPPAPTGESRYYDLLRDKITAVIGAKVDFNRKDKNGKNPKGGKLEIAYRDSEQLEEIIRRLCGDAIFDEM